MDLLLQRLLALGCRMARPGEFSERAFLNDKMDITQAEAVADLIDAGTTSAAHAAVRSMQGAFSMRIGELQALLTGLRIYVEAAIDFPDDDIDLLSAPALANRVSQVFAAFDAIKAAARQGALLREGLTVVLAGRPNAGKSSLLNRLVGDDVAIVTAIPGTTRDVLRHHLQFDGLPVTLIDTAGLREAVDAVEAEGIRRAQGEMQRADRVLYVVDATVDDAAAEAEDLREVPVSVPITVLVNKIDLIDAMAHLEAGARPRVFLSARTGDGVDVLRAHLKTAAGYRDDNERAFSARRRHLDALERADQLVRQAAETLGATHAVELFAEDLRLAQHALGEITGDFSSDDLLGQIFGSFCIGK